MIGEFRALAQARSSVVLWALGEIFIVVAGVLIAFGLNAWWVERTTRAEEQTHLRALARDFERNVGVYKVLLEREERLVTASLELLQLARKQPDADPTRVRPLVDAVFSSLRQEPALDAYEALVNSAGLALLSDEKLRADLAGFATRVSDPYSEWFSNQLYMTFTTRFIGRLQYAAVIGGDAEALQSYAELLSDPAFQEHVAFRYLSERDVASDYRERLREAEAIYARLQAQLEP
jgi:hypothetical protein